MCACVCGEGNGGGRKAGCQITLEGDSFVTSTGLALPLEMTLLFLNLALPKAGFNLWEEVGGVWVAGRGRRSITSKTTHLGRRQLHGLDGSGFAVGHDLDVLHHAGDEGRTRGRGRGGWEPHHLLDLAVLSGQEEDVQKILLGGHVVHHQMRPPGEKRQIHVNAEHIRVFFNTLTLNTSGFVLTRQRWTHQDLFKQVNTGHIGSF